MAEIGSSVSLYSYWGNHGRASTNLQKLGINLPPQEAASLPKDDIIIFTPKSFAGIGEDQIKNTIILRKRDILYALNNGSHVCVLVNNDLHPLFIATLNEFGVKFSRLEKEIQELKIKRSEFEGFLDKYGTAFGTFPYDSSFASVICTIENNTSMITENSLYKKEAVVGLSKKQSAGIITLLPFFVHDNTYSAGDGWGNIVSELVTAVKTHRANLVFDKPEWVSEIKLKKEINLEMEINLLESQMEEKKKLFESQINIKSVLWLKHDELRNASMKLMNEFSIDTLEEDIGEEDFWLLDENGVKFCMCESKGKDNNLERTDISKFDEHREAREKDENFPSLLIVNSFNKASSMQEKDIEIPSNVIQKAVRNNILVARTIDLIRLLDLFQNKKATKKQIVNFIREKHGWLRITDKLELVDK